MPKVIGIVGSRRRNSTNDFNLLLNKFNEIYEEGDKIISGGCYKGADKFAEYIAKSQCVPITIYYANWDKYGKGAGFKRNTYIAGECDVLLALVAEDRTGGTEDTIKKAEKLGKTIILL